VIVPGGTNPTQLRDPKVIWYESTQSWIAVIAYPVNFKISVFSSPNLIDWTPQSNFSDYGVTGLQYECPNMVDMRVMGDSNSTEKSMYVVLISVNPGAPLGGSIIQYLVGNFNGTHFEALDSRTRFTNFAKDIYAGQFFSGIPTDEDQLTVNWASNWQYTNIVSTAGKEVGNGFRSVMTVLRGHYLKDLPRFELSLISYLSAVGLE
jgi:beta-fructofuranosidase